MKYCVNIFFLSLFLISFILNISLQLFSPHNLNLISADQAEQYNGISYEMNAGFFQKDPGCYLISGIIVIISLIYVVMRSKQVKRRNLNLQNEIRDRTAKVEMQKKEILNQKEEIEAQMEFVSQQKEMIEEQNKELEKHRGQLGKMVELKTRDLQEALEKAEESDKLKTAFLANMSHEIRTPMNAIMGFAHLLDDPITSPQSRQKYIATINNNCDILLKLIDDILDISKIETGQLKIFNSEFNLKKMLHELYIQFTRTLKGQGKDHLNLKLNVNGIDNDQNIYTDQVRLKQILSNLMSNAIKYTDEGEIEFGCELTRNNMFKKEIDGFKFYVKDTGIGIPVEKMESIFSRFSKVEEDITRLYRGAGLGLTISKKLVDIMGGEIWVHSKVSEGSTFYFSLPYITIERQADDRELPVRLSSKLKKVNYNWKSKTILIVEDEDHNYIYAKEILKRTGVQTLRAVNGKEAITIFKENEVDLILMDIKLPEIDGYDATRIIKKKKNDVVIIAVTAYSMSSEKDISKKAGCDDYIAKPYPPFKLLEMINKYF